MAVISMRQFLEAGVHFGHQTKRWNPNMAPYIYGVKSGIHIIDLRQSLKQLKVAYEYAKTTASEGQEGRTRLPPMPFNRPPPKIGPPKTFRRLTLFGSAATAPHFQMKSLVNRKSSG